MGSVVEFLDAFKRLLSRRGWRSSPTPWAVVESWESWVVKFEEGYDWSFDEYMNDCACRGLLEAAFSDSEMKGFPEQLDAMKERVHEADKRVKALFLPGVEIGSPEWPWWLRGVLRNGIGAYAEDMKRGFGIDIAAEL